jgi:hypothetical protein
MEGYPPVEKKRVFFSNIPCGMIFYKSADILNGSRTINPFVKISDDMAMWLEHTGSKKSGGQCLFKPEIEVTVEYMMERDVYDSLTASLR